MAIIVPILSTFDPKGVNQADKSFKGITKEANLLKTALAGIGIAATIKGLQSTVMAASNLSESIAKSNTVFGKNAQAIQDWSKTTANALGVSRQAALEAAGTYGNLFRAFGINEQESAKMSTALVTLAADLASFNNVPIDDALLALRSGLSGETEPLKRFGIALNEARLKEEALRLGLIKTTSGTLPQAIKTQAAYALIMKDSALAQGDVARTAGGLANQLKFLKAGLDDAKAGFGEALLPIVLNVVTALNKDLLPAVQNTTKAFGEQGVAGGFKTAAVEVSNLLNNMTGLGKVIKDVVLALVGMKIAAIALAVAPPIIAGITSALTAMRIATLYGAAGFGVLATAIRGALASTGIGLLVVGLGLIIGKLIETRIEVTATDKTIRFMESNGVQSFRNMGQAAYLMNNQIAGNIVTLNAVQLAATRVADAADIMNQKFYKIRVQQGKNTYNPVAAPDTALGGTTAKASKAAAAITGISDAVKRAQANFEKLSDELTQAKDKFSSLGDELKTQNDNLKNAVDAYKSFKDSIKNVITGIVDFGSAAKAETGTFLENLVGQASKAAEFATKVQKLIQMGLSESALAQVLASGADAGTKIADEIIAGGATVVTQVNTLVSATDEVAKQLADAMPAEFYKAGITAGEALVQGVKDAIAGAAVTLATAEASAGAAATVVNQESVNFVNQTLAKFKKSGKGLSKSEKQNITDLATQLNIPIPAMAKGGIVTGPTLALIGEAGPEAVVPLSGRNAGMGNTINLTVNAGMGADGASIGREIVDIIKRYERVSGPVFASA
jgi:hypothetical protein